MAQPTVIFVTGMHRSGTSVAARAVQAAGYELGGNLMPPGPDNPRGFFEDVEVVRLNDRILKTAGWDWKTAERALYFQELGPNLWEDIRKFVRKMYAWGLHVAIKDPRFCVTLPVWLRAMVDIGGLPPLGLILAIRNPNEVAKSVQRRDSISLDKATALWESYTRAIIEQLIIFPRFCVLRYESMISDPGRELDTMNWMMGTDIEDHEREKFKDFVAKGLHRQREENVNLTGETAELWETISKIREHQLVRTYV